MTIRVVSPAPQATIPAIRFLRKKPVMLMTGLSASGIYDLMNRGSFPQVDQATRRQVCRGLSDIEEWQRQVIATANSANDAKRRSS